MEKNPTLYIPLRTYKILGIAINIYFLKTSCLMEPESRICFNFALHSSYFPSLLLLVFYQRPPPPPRLFFPLNPGRKLSFHAQNFIVSSPCGHVSRPQIKYPQAATRHRDLFSYLASEQVFKLSPSLHSGARSQNSYQVVSAPSRFTQRRPQI